ncbi:MAG TPA: hypothetical protein DDY82_01610 [Clostridiales bacterium]|nr:hypothetical protein [Clostridiales bacterium]
MAWKDNYHINKKTKSSSKTSGKSKSKYTEIERLSYMLGQIQAGLANSDSRVYESYNNGKNSTKKKTKKSLF